MAVDWKALFKAAQTKNSDAVPIALEKPVSRWNPKTWDIGDYGALASILGVGWLLYKDLSKKR